MAITDQNGTTRRSYRKWLSLVSIGQDVEQPPGVVICNQKVSYRGPVYPHQTQIVVIGLETFHKRYKLMTSRQI